jgi:hypothetical protein
VAKQVDYAVDDVDSLVEVCWKEVGRHQRGKGEKRGAGCVRKMCVRVWAGQDAQDRRSRQRWRTTAPGAELSARTGAPDSGGGGSGSTDLLLGGVGFNDLVGDFFLAALAHGVLLVCDTSRAGRRLTQIRS